jgi:hypothetical protein
MPVFCGVFNCFATASVRISKEGGQIKIVEDDRAIGPADYQQPFGVQAVFCPAHRKEQEAAWRQLGHPRVV